MPASSMRGNFIKPCGAIMFIFTGFYYYKTAGQILQSPFYPICHLPGDFLVGEVNWLL